MPIISRPNPKFGDVDEHTAYAVLRDMYSRVMPGDRMDAFWLIHPQAWRDIARGLLDGRRLAENPPVRPLSIQDDPDPPDRLFGLPLFVRDDGQDSGDIQIWAENHIERAIRRNPNVSINVHKFSMPETPPPPPPTLRALLAKWFRKAGNR